MIKTILLLMTSHRYYLTPLILTFLSLIMISGSIAYLICGLPTLAIVLVCLISLGATIYFKKYFYQPDIDNEKIKHTIVSKKVLTLSLIYKLLFLIGIVILFKNQSSRPLLSPWDVIPNMEFIIYGLATFCLFGLFHLAEKKLSPLFLILHFLWSFGVAMIVYSIGYGFDPFVHQAAIKAIEELGRIYPTTVYYLGQYSLVVWLHTFIGGTIALWDKLLVPVIAAIFVPLALNRSLHTTINRSNSIILGLLILPFSLFIVTTPQNLAYIFLLLTIIWSLKINNRGDEILLSLLALAALVCQPIAGIPALLLVFTIFIQKISSKNLQKILYTLSILGYVVILPLAFIIVSKVNLGGIETLSISNLRSLFSFLKLENPIKENIWLNLTYFIAASKGLLIILIILFGVLIAYKKKLKNYFFFYIWPAFALIISAILTLTINFHYLIDYERIDYPIRLLWVATLFCIPCICLVLEDFFERIVKQDIAETLGWAIFITILITNSFYISYPRFDHYANSHGYGTSQADIMAVHQINDMTKNKPFVVLANQQVSAAALREFGFKQYYNSLFYYPVPTGGPLYQYYLEMIKKPNLESIQKVKDLSGVSTVYFVLNDYWFEAKKLGPELSALANETIPVADGQVTIFVFNN